MVLGVVGVVMGGLVGGSAGEGLGSVLSLSRLARLAQKGKRRVRPNQDTSCRKCIRRVGKLMILLWTAVIQRIHWVPSLSNMLSCLSLCECTKTKT